MRRKLGAEQTRALINEYGIKFEGPKPRTSWPVEYRDIFGQIRCISLLRYDDYGPTDKKGTLEIEEEKSRVRQLNTQAYSCRTQRLNEQGWRLQIEHKVLFRFSAEAVCKTCHNRLWISDYQVHPHDTFGLELLSERRARRILCRCDASSRAAQDANEAGEVLMFSSRAGQTLLHDPEDHLAEKGLPAFEPDRVFGLGVTKTFDRCMSLQADLRHSPFKDGKLLYPFLIIEAKSEKGSPGFEFIETQTAFPLRSCLKLQAGLRCSPQNGINPLVWFISYQGDQWRVGAGICAGSEYKIYDLWQGTILAQDDALQLLQIVDCICDWAYDIYRFNVFRCLSNGRVNLREFTPALTVISSQTDPEEVTSPRSDTSTTTGNNDNIWAAINPSNDDDELMQDVAPVMADMELCEPKSPQTQHPLLASTGAPEHLAASTRTASLRSPNLVFFTFEHLPLPEEPTALASALKALQPKLKIEDTARLVIMMLQDGVTITIEGVSQLEQLWTQTDQVLDADCDEPVRAWVTFQTFFDPESWHVVRTLTCITCSLNAADQLARVIRRSFREVLSIEHDNVHRCPCLANNAQALRKYSGRDSADSCMQNVCYNLSFALGETGAFHFQWNYKPDPMPTKWNTQPQSSVLGPLGNDTSFKWTHVRVLSELLPGKSLPESLRSFPRTPTAWTAGVLLSNLSSSPKYCLLILEDWWRYSGNESLFSEMITLVVSQGFIFDISIRRFQETGEDEKQMLGSLSDLTAVADLVEHFWPKMRRRS